MRPPSGTGPAGLQVQRQFEGNRFAQDSQARAYQQLLAVLRGSPTRTRSTGPRGGNREPTLVEPEGVAA
jgi:hypothetical protein